MRKIVIIDTGVDINNKNINLNRIKRINLFNQYNPFEDYIGHGTAITYIIQNNTFDTEIYTVNIYGKNSFTNEEKLYDKLLYIYEYERYRFDSYK